MRSLSTLDVTALGVNGIIGAGIFVLPGRVDELMGPAALVATAFAGVLCFLIALCFAEVGSQFSATGGPYVYARAAFGSLVGFEVGWMTCWIRIISWAALANFFTIALARFVPGAAEGAMQKAIIVGLLTALATVNARGVKNGAVLTDVFTVAKLIPLLVLILVGVFFIDGSRFEPFAPHGYDGLGKATLLILFAFAGFEALPIPAGEMRDPRHSVAVALILMMSIVSVVYLAVQSVTIGTVEQLAGAKSPLVDSGRAFMGKVGGALVGAGFVVSMLGINAGSALIAPRSLFALAEQGQIPAVLGRLHAAYRTPVVAIVVSSLLSIALAVSGSFEDLVIVSVVARLVQYLPTILAVLVLRRRSPLAEGAYRTPGGPVVPVLAAALSLALLLQAEPKELLAGTVLLALGVPFYLIFRHKPGAEGALKP